MNNNFYKAFEDRHRGSRELIKSRLKFYLPFLDKLKDIKSTFGFKEEELNFGLSGSLIGAAV